VSVPKRRPLLFAGIGLAVVAALVMTVTLGGHGIAAQLHRWKLLPEPEQLTELYFTDHTKLPAVYLPGIPQTLAFTVHNLENQTTTYRYIVEELAPDAQPVLLGSGSFTVHSNQSHNESIAVTPADVGRAQVRITLQPGNEKINYWMDRG
jgi:hypothetical protein